MYSRGQKKFTFRLRRTVEKRSVPFPLYGQPFRGTRSENGQLYGKSTVAKRKRNGRFLANRTSVIRRRRSVYDEPVQDDGDQR